MRKNKIFILKMDGTKEEYNPNKLRISMERVTKNDELISDVLEEADKFVRDGMSTNELYKFVFSRLRRRDKVSGMKYKLKKAIIDLRIQGGFTFEKFVALVLEKQGYRTELNNIMQGNIITHEIDVSAFKENEKVMVEAKHHHEPWLGVSVQTALYVYARFLDLQKHYNKPMLVTNTKFSGQVKKYAHGIGMRLMGWGYPKGDSLEENIEKYKIYPITVLSLQRHEIVRYLEKKILTIEQLSKEKNVSDKIRREIEQIMDEGF